MKLVFTELGWEDYLWFQDNDRQLLKRINLLIRGNYSAVAQKPGFSCGDMAFVCADAFHGTMTLVCETKTRFLMRCLSSYCIDRKKL